MGKPSAPAAPDYAAAATAQGTANVNSAVASNRLNQANQVGPYGSLTYSYSTPDSGQGYTDPQTGQYIPQVTATTTLDPAQQKLLDQNNQISTSLNDLASSGIGYVADKAANPLTASSLPALQTSVATPTYNATQLTANPTVSSVSASTPIQTSLDYSSLGALPSASDFANQRDQITNAYMARLQPLMNQQQAALQARMANQGITLGSQANTAAQFNLDQAQNDQRMAALLAGDTQQQNDFNNAMSIYQQKASNLQNAGTFANSAQNQSFTQGLANANLANSAASQTFNQNLQGQQTANQALQAQYQSGLASAQFANQAQQQALQEADYFQNAPLNMLNALRTGNQVTTPQFSNVSGGAQVAAAPVMQAAQSQYSAAMQQYQAQMQAYSSALSGVSGLGSAYLGTL